MDQTAPSCPARDTHHPIAQLRTARRGAATPSVSMQFNLGNLFGGGGDKPPPGKTVSLKEAGIVPDVLAEEFETKTVASACYMFLFTSAACTRQPFMMRVCSDSRRVVWPCRT